MTKFPTMSARTRSALASREPFQTYGSFYAEDGGTPWNFGRLPQPWRAQYTDAARLNRVVYTVFSYSTPIAWVLDDKITGEVVIPRETSGRNAGQPVKYSVTTSKHQSMLYALEADRTTRGDIHEWAAREGQTARDRRNDAAERRWARLGPAPVSHNYSDAREERPIPTEIMRGVVADLRAQAPGGRVSAPQEAPGGSVIRLPERSHTGVTAASVAATLAQIDARDAEMRSARAEDYDTYALRRSGMVLGDDGVWFLRVDYQSTDHTDYPGNSLHLGYSEEWNARHGNTWEGDWRDER